MMPERKEEAASAAELAVEPAGKAGIAEAAERGADGATTEPEEFTGINGVSAREREVESTRPHGAEEGRTEAEERSSRFRGLLNILHHYPVWFEYIPLLEV